MRLRDLLPHRRRTTTPVPAPATVAALLFPRADSWRSDLCQTDLPQAHAKCGHPMNAGRTDGCSCRCHTPTTTYGDGGLA